MTPARCLGSITLASMFLLAIAPVEAQSFAQAVPGRAQAPTSVRTTPLDRVVTLELRDLTLDRALREIDRQASLGLTYTERVVPVERRVTLVARAMPAREALRRVLDGTGVRAELTDAGTVILVRAPQLTPAAPPAGAADTVKRSTVAGMVTDAADGQPLVGATVTLTDANGGRMQLRTIREGSYIFRDVPVGEYTVSVRMLGYAPQERRATVELPMPLVSFALVKREIQLDQVVVTATGERRRVELGNDISVIDVPKVMQERPVTSLVDLLDGRVPGLTVQRSSGAPGDPARIRIRGEGSVFQSNDPIVIVDGIRIYARQSAERSANSANPNFAAPSPLESIDPSIVERVEVLKGPSAATLYGADAANGVIVVTTMRGRAGPPRWSVTAERGITTTAKRFPTAMANWGHDALAPDRRMFCGPVAPQCISDSVVTFQSLNDPDLTILANGEASQLNLGVSGGSQGFTYRMSGSYSDELGRVRLPAVEAARYARRMGEAPPDWMLRPQRYSKWGVSSTIGTDIGPRATAGLMTSFTHGDQRRSTLEGELNNVAATYFDRTTGQYYRVPDARTSIATPGDALLNRFVERGTAQYSAFSTALNLTWRARDWLTTVVGAGLQLREENEGASIMRGAIQAEDRLIFGPDTLGRVSVGRGRTMQGTLNARATMRRALPLGWGVDLSLGGNYSSESASDVTLTGRDLPTGSASITKAGMLLSARETAEEMSSFGVYVEPSFNHRQRLFVSGAVRLDGGSTYGSNVSLEAFPKVSLSYLVSEEPFFPFRDHVGSLRLRLAYGHAGVQPGPSDRLRIYSDKRTWENGYQPGAAIEFLGNTELRPERAAELEGGFDADLLGDRVSVSYTAYRKTRVDALMHMPLPPSVYGSDVSILRNVGVIRNTGWTTELRTEPLRTDALNWNVSVNVGRNRNLMVELGPGVDPFFTSQNERVVAGYPLRSRWEKPILGFSDRNEDGRITTDELLIGDTLVYMGVAIPDYTAGLHTSIGLFRRSLTVSASVEYQDDFTQEGTFGKLGVFSPAYADPNSPLAAQAAMVGLLDPQRGPLTRSNYWNIQTVSTLRLSSMAFTWAVPRTLAARAGARALTVSLQGSNLGLRTSYRGLDPHVNGHSTGNKVADTGVIPQPRHWQLRVQAQY